MPTTSKVKSFSRVRLCVTSWTVATRLLHPWTFLGKSTAVGFHFLLQGIFPSQRSNQGPILWADALLSEPPGNQVFTNQDDSQLNIRDSLQVMYLMSGSYVN